ncbi:DoxX family protein [Nocardia goodfellowii]|uniref:Membrane protein n=1 Tax=Nocardia goodfellowii TaxID=882446 RepID=A0ABS4QDL2_9NOCA|nr:DoxX family protein [Nocardia goodfellowii]MBP2189781.1 putative membrane protein [Nocardia goodfellowii]
MAPLLVLAVITLLARLTGWLGDIAWLDSWPRAATLGLAAMFLLTASAHFAEPRRGALVAMVPPRLPNPGAWVTGTGVLEIAGAVGLLIPATAKLAAICLALLLIAMFPANIRAARANLGIKTMPLPVRTLVQGVFLGATALVVFG